MAVSATCLETAAGGRTAMTTLEVSRHFDALYETLSTSRAHAEIGREALGEGFVGQLGCASEAELYELAERAGVRSGGRTLELCCGTGGTCAWLAEHTTNLVTGLDISQVGIALAAHNARQGSRSNLDFVVGNVANLPFATASFDSIVCLDGFGTNFTRIFNQCRRVLRPGGALALLLNVRQSQAADTSSALRGASFENVRAASVADDASVLMQRWLRAYKRRAREHIAEVGRYNHHALTSEIADLLERYRDGAVERLLISGIASEK